MTDHPLQEATQRQIYEGPHYAPETICRRLSPHDDGYFDKLLSRRFGIIKQYAAGRRVLDLCCATGEHLMALAPDIQSGIGLDFSHIFIERAKRLREERGIGNLLFIQANARKTPFPDQVFDVVYSLSSLYQIPAVGDVVIETARILQPGGYALLEFGNRCALNTLVARAYPELPPHQHLSIMRMRQLLTDAGLVIQAHYAFQLLPLWGQRPWWLRPLSSRPMESLMTRHRGGRTLDEWLCSLPVLRRFAFRHFFVCQSRTWQP